MIISKEMLETDILIHSTKEIAEKYKVTSRHIRYMCKKYNIRKEVDFVGLKWNKFTVLSKIGSRGESGKQAMYWLCRCECGNYRELQTRDVKRQSWISCGCWSKSREYRNTHHRWNGYEDIHGKWWNNIKRGANKRGYEFLITIQYMWNLYIKQNKRCALSGLDIVFAKTSRGFQEGETTASIDRINNSYGYIEENVQWVHKDVNLMKQKYTQKHFIDMCSSIANYSLNKEI